MIVAYIMIGSIAGVLAFAVALFLGASFWLAFGLYALVGTVAMILVPTAGMLTGVLMGRNKAPTSEDGPIDADNPGSAEPLAIQQDTAEASMRILAVDDDPFILELVPMLSEKAGFSEVTPASSGEQALEILRKSDVTFDCLLLDISMPGMDGVELCRRIRQNSKYRETPIIMLTAMRDMASMGDAYRTGATDYITKPFDIDALAARLRLAQEAISAKRVSESATEEGTESNSTAVSNHEFERLDGLRLGEVESLVDHTVFSNYLTQLPRKEVDGVHVFAATLDGIEAVHTHSSPRQFAALLNGVAAAAANCLGTDQTVMAYTDNATLLIATNSENPTPAIDIEKQLQVKISETDAGEGTEVKVLVGGPVQLQRSTAGRARMATDNVIALAKRRSRNKYGNQAVGMSRR